MQVKPYNLERVVDMSDESSNGISRWLFWVGHIIAVVLSAKLNGSILWGILHLFIGWIYVIYALIFRFAEIKAIFN